MWARYTIPDKLYNQLLKGNVEFDRVKRKGEVLYATHRKDPAKLAGGPILEMFMFGRSNDGSPVKYESFEEAFCTALEKGVDRQALLKEKCYINTLFSQVCVNLPSEEKEKLGVYIVVGTALDRFHSFDAVFVLGDRYIGIDASMDPFGLGEELNNAKGIVRVMKEKRADVLKFTHYDGLAPHLSQQFSEQVARQLLLGIHRLPHKAYKIIRSRQKKARAHNN